MTSQELICLSVSNEIVETDFVELSVCYFMYTRLTNKLCIFPEIYKHTKI